MPIYIYWRWNKFPCVPPISWCYIAWYHVASHVAIPNYIAPYINNTQYRMNGRSEYEYPIISKRAICDIVSHMVWCHISMIFSKCIAFCMTSRFRLVSMIIGIFVVCFSLINTIIAKFLDKISLDVHMFLSQEYFIDFHDIHIHCGQTKVAWFLWYKYKFEITLYIFFCHWYSKQYGIRRIDEYNSSFHQ